MGQAPPNILVRISIKHLNQKGCEVMDNNWDIISVLSHSRHDWLNRIQLIKGYLSLNDTDKVSELIDSFTQESNKETVVSNLAMNSFVSYILTFNWENHPIMLDYEVEGPVRKLAIYDKEMYDFIKAFFEMLENQVEMFVENQMTITFEINEEDICFFFDFRGKLQASESVKRWLQDYSGLEHLSISHVNITEEEMTITIS